MATGTHTHILRADVRLSSSRPHPIYLPAPLLNHQIHARHHPSAPPVLHELFCAYRSKVCMNHRARKRDGSLHRYCEHHRQRANLNQKKWANRRFYHTREREQPHTHAQPVQPLPSYQQLLALSNGRQPCKSFSDSERADVAKADTATDAWASREEAACRQGTSTNHKGETRWPSRAALPHTDEVREYSF